LAPFSSNEPLQQCAFFFFFFFYSIITFSLYSIIEETLWTDQRLLWDIEDEARCVPIVGFDVLENALPLEPRQFQGAEKLIWTPSTDIVNVVTRQYGQSFAISHPDATTHRVWWY
jgi:hypothetical protein